MKLAITSKNKTLDADVDPRFGRCAYFLVVDSETMEVNVIQNASVMAAGGAGIQAAQTIANAGVNVVLTGNVGPNAFDTLSAAGIQIITGVQGTVKDVVEQYKKGVYAETNNPTVGSHAGQRG